MSKNTHQKFGYAPTGGAGYSGRKSTPQSSEMEKLSRILINDPTKPTIRRSSEPQGGQMDYVKREDYILWHHWSEAADQVRQEIAALEKVAAEGLYTESASYVSG